MRISFNDIFCLTTLRSKSTVEKQLKKLKTRYEDLLKEKTFTEEQLTAEKIKYENDILHLNARLSQLQDENTAAANANASSFVGNDNNMSRTDGGDEEVRQTFPM